MSQHGAGGHMGNDEGQSQGRRRESNGSVMIWILNDPLKLMC